MGDGRYGGGPASSVSHADHERRTSSIKPTILLASGREYDFLNPTRLTIDEVAPALSKLCRYTGHCTEFWSVAQHSIAVASLLPCEIALQGLLHDAVEAVLGDMSGPLKQLIPEYKALERKIEKVVLAGFGLPEELDPRVKRADLVALLCERESIMLNRGQGIEWHCLEGIEMPTHNPLKKDSWLRGLSMPEVEFWFKRSYVNLMTGKQ